MPSARYWELTVPVSPDAAEGLTNLVWELGALGVVEEARPDGAPWLRAFFPDTHDVAALAGHVDTYLDSLVRLGFAAPRGARVTPLADENWAEAWRAHFRAINSGKVVRFEADNLRALNFLLSDSLGGGGSASLRTDAQGKTHGLALLQLELDVPEEVLTETPEPG